MSKKMKQKLIGLALVALGIIMLILTKDATASLFIVPLGLFVLFTKDDVIY